MSAAGRTPERASITSGGLLLDAGFPARVARTTAAVAVVLSVLAYDRFGWRGCAGLLVGASLGIFSLLSIAWAVTHLTGHGAGTGVPRRLTFLFVMKLPLMSLLLWLLTWFAGSRLVVLGAAALGASLIPTVILLKVTGLWLVALLGGPLPRERGSKNA